MRNKAVAIVMGSDSDLSIMKNAALILEEFKVEFTIRILSVHRTPEKLVPWVEKLSTSNYQVIIAGAGGAAHLAGVIAAHTTLPVIGVPISSSLQGLDSLFSTVQMPEGIPVATVGIDRSRNAALLAISIIALKDKKLRNKLEEYRSNMRNNIIKKDDKLEQLGWKKYI
ncbi:MAG: 5-(carboxyamino)imidazole ribonucleotide mutase [Candidatus Firestonebacteria bacterium]|nr:5-(carboxyamino)imidazole ribonucleotide mutase [Candidatus Firestonebacteria bacterium]